MERISTTQLEKRIEFMRKCGFDVGYDKYVGFAITNAAQSRKFSSRGSKSQAFEFLCGMEEGQRQTLQMLKKKFPKVFEDLESEHAQVKGMALTDEDVQRAHFLEFFKYPVLKEPFI